LLLLAVPRSDAPIRDHSLYGAPRFLDYGGRSDFFCGAGYFREYVPATTGRRGFFPSSSVCCSVLDVDDVGVISPVAKREELFWRLFLMKAICKYTPPAAGLLPTLALHLDAAAQEVIFGG